MWTVSFFLFRKSSVDKVFSPEKLDTAIQVVNPQFILIVAAVFLLMGALVLWSAFGEVQSCADAVAIPTEGGVICYADARDRHAMRPGLEVVTATGTGSIAEVSGTPISRAEAETEIGDAYTAYIARLSDWNIRLRLDVAPAAEQAFPVTIIAERMRPIELFLNRQQGTGEIR